MGGEEARRQEGRARNARAHTHVPPPGSLSRSCAVLPLPPASASMSWAADAEPTVCAMVEATPMPSLARPESCGAVRGEVEGGAGVRSDAAGAQAARRSAAHGQQPTAPTQSQPARLAGRLLRQARLLDEASQLAQQALALPLRERRGGRAGPGGLSEGRQQAEFQVHSRPPAHSPSLSPRLAPG